MTTTIRVLYVDDEAELLNIGKLFLERSGDFTVTTSLSASEAIRLLEEEKFNAIISDYQMPGMDGIQFLVEVRKHFGPIPFILFTGRGREEVVIQAINSGADFYLQKGGDPKAQFAELSQKIKSAASRKRAEDSLAESERVHATMISNLPGFVYRCANDHDWTMEYISDGCREITGYSPDELLFNKTRTYNDLIHPDFQKPLWDKVQNFLEKRELFAVEYPIITKKGETRWVWERGQGIYSDDGRLLFLEGFITDITGRKRADETIRTAEDTYRNIFLNSQIGLFRTDIRTGQLLDANDAVARFIGYPDRDSLLARPFNIAERYVDAYDREKITALLQADGEFRNYEARFLKNDGSIILMRFSGRLVKEKGWIEGVSEDITDRKRAEGALQESEEQSRNLLSQLPDIVMVHQNGIIVYANQTAVDKTGFAKEELIGSHLFDHVVPEAKESIVRNMAKRAAGESVEDYEIDMIHKSGALHHVIVRTSPTVFNGLPSVVIILIDITERKTAEVALKESENLYRTIFETTGAATIIIENDTRIIRANARFATLSGFSLDELEGKKSWTEFVLPEDLKQMKRYHRERREDPSAETRVYEFRFINRHGEIRYCINNVSVIPGTTRSVASVVDITDRKLSEEVLRESEEKYRGIFDESIAAVYVFDNKKNFINTNQAGLDFLGYSREELLHMSIPDVDADPDIVLPAHQELLSGGRLINYEHRLLRKDGKIITVLNNSRPLTDLHGNVIGLLSTLFDITERKVAEEATRRLTGFQESVIANARVWLSVLDLSGKILIWNTAAEEISGYSSKEVIGKKDIWKKIYPEKEYRKQITDTINRIIRDKNYLENFETTILSKQGIKKVISWNTRGIFNAAGNVSDYIAIGVDITNRIRAEEALKESEETFRIHIENSFDVIFTLNSDGEFVFVSPAWERHFGYPVSDGIGKSFAQFVHPDDIAPLMEYLKRVLTTGQSEASPAYRVRHADGRWLWFIANGTPIVNTKGERQFVGVGRDITERKVAEEALRESKTLIEAVVENVPLMIFLKEATDLRFVIFNKAGEELLGYDRKVLLGKNNLDLFPPEQAAHFMAKDREVLDGEAGMLDIPEESILTAKKGQRLLHTRKVCIRGGDGTTKFLLGISEDITESKELEKEMEYHTHELQKFSASLATANKKLNLLSSITRHDINNQLMVLMGFLTIIKKKQPDPELNEYFVKVSNAAQRISSMIQFTREYEAIGVSTPVWQDTRTLVNTAAQQALLGQIIVKNDLPAGAEVFADPLIVKVCYNLMDNAVRYGGKITTIRFSVEETGNEHMIVCEDDGDGVVAEEKEKIFVRGFGKNTGLGLALAREILDITGITIRETGEPGKGARFEMVVPKGALRIGKEPE